MSAPSILAATPRSHVAFTHVADRVGAGASFLCAIHCAALPFVMAVLPALGLGFLADHGFERGFIAFASVLALGMAYVGYRRHRIARAFAVLLPGLVLLWMGGFLIDPERATLWHSVFVVAGGSCVCVAHIVNLRLARRNACNCVTRA